MEPFATDDMKSSRFFDPSRMMINKDERLVSPVPNTCTVLDQDVCQEKRKEEPLAANIVAPAAKKIVMSSNSKVSDYKYKNSISSAIENAKNLPFRSKNNSRLVKMPLSNSKMPSSSRGSHFISA